MPSVTFSRNHSSPAFAGLLKRALKTPTDEQRYLRDLALLTRQQFAADVRAHRQSKRWSQAELAQKIGTTQAVISRVEQAKTDPGLGLLVRLKTALGVSIIV